MGFIPFCALSEAKGMGIKMKKITIIHTSFVLVDIITELFNKIIPEAELVHIVDDSVLSEILLEKKITKKVLRRMLSYFKAAKILGLM